MASVTFLAAAPDDPLDVVLNSVERRLRQGRARVADMAMPGYHIAATLREKFGDKLKSLTCIGEASSQLVAPEGCKAVTASPLSLRERIDRSSFDILTCRGVLTRLPESRYSDALDQIRKVTRPDALIVVQDFVSQDEDVCDAVEDLFRVQRRIHGRTKDVSILPTDECVQFMRDAQFDITDVQNGNTTFELMRYFQSRGVVDLPGAYTTMQRHLEGSTLLPSIFEDGKITVTLPLTTIIAANEKDADRKSKK